MVEFTNQEYDHEHAHWDKRVDINRRQRTLGRFTLGYIKMNLLKKSRLAGIQHQVKEQDKITATKLFNNAYLKIFKNI